MLYDIVFLFEIWYHFTKKEEVVMAVCPKCRKKLKIWHVSQYCPYCGTNIVFHSFETNFEKDKRIAEMSLANFRVKLEKAKKAYVSGWPQKLKIAACRWRDCSSPSARFPFPPRCWKRPSPSGRWIWFTTLLWARAITALSPRLPARPFSGRPLRRCARPCCALP